MRVLTVLTWLAVAVLSFGSISVFIFFLRDVRAVLPEATGDGAADHDHRAT